MARHAHADRLADRGEEDGLDADVLDFCDGEVRRRGRCGGEVRRDGGWPGRVVCEGGRDGEWRVEGVFGDGVDGHGRGDVWVAGWGGLGDGCGCGVCSGDAAGVGGLGVVAFSGGGLRVGSHGLDFVLGLG